jgi:hypothetical protein
MPGSDQVANRAAVSRRQPVPRLPAALARRYRREIIAVVLIKLVLLGVAYQLWFAHPLARHMRVPRPLVDQHLFGTANPPDSSTQGVSP